VASRPDPFPPIFYWRGACDRRMRSWWWCWRPRGDGWRRASGSILAFTLLVSVRPAPAAEPLEARGRLDLRASLAVRDDTVATGDRRIRARGEAPSQLLLDGLWLAANRPFGVALRLDAQRFSLRGEDPLSSSEATATALDTSAALAARWLGAGGRLSLEGQLGYGLLRLPLAQVGPAATSGAMPVSATALNAHGPLLAGRLAVSAGALGFEAGARVRPLTFGGRLAGAALNPRGLGASAAVTVGNVAAAGMRFAGLLGYELSAVRGSGEAAGGPATIRQVQHAFGLGVRASFCLPAVAPAPALAEPGPILPAAPRGVIVRGVVRAAYGSTRAAAGSPLPDVTVSVVDGAVVTTDASGRFELTGLLPGLARLQLRGDGLIAEEEVLSVPPDGEVQVEILLRPVESSRLAAVIGTLQSEAGPAADASVTVVELALVVRSDADGRFRLEVPAGRYTLLIEGPGLRAQRKPIAVGAGEHSIHNVLLERAP
jgi:Carboxypeptidase regulatory-like domain